MDTAARRTRNIIWFVVAFLVIAVINFLFSTAPRTLYLPAATPYQVGQRLGYLIGLYVSPPLWIAGGFFLAYWLRERAAASAARSNRLMLYGFAGLAALLATLVLVLLLRSLWPA